jgi:tetratricopeptide (TPR) repeat protein
MLKKPLIYNPIVHISLIILLGLIAYSNTFHSPFVFDDRSNIVENYRIKNLDNFWPPSGTRWLGSLTFAINYRFGGIAPVGYHIVNVAIHILNAVLVYWLVLLTLKTPYVISVNKTHGDNQYLAALFSSLLFLSHPVQTQAVTYIVQRFASLAALFYLLTLVMYIKFRRQQSAISGQQKQHTARYMIYTISLIFAVFAMKTKEIAFTLPVVLCIYEFMFFQGEIKKRLLYLVPFVLTMLIIPLTLTGAGGSLTEISGIDEAAASITETQEISRLDYLYTQFRVIVTYIRLLFLPINQNLDYDYPIYSRFFNPEVFISFMFLLSVFALGVYLYRISRHPETKDRSWLRLISFGIFWFFVTLSVESSITPIRDVIFDHRVYLPSVGFFMALTSTMGLVAARWGERVSYANKALVYVMLLVVIVLSAATYARNYVWEDSVRLWEDTVKKSPGKARAHINLGNAYDTQGALRKAFHHFETALRIYPYYVEAHINLGKLNDILGLTDIAIEHLYAAIQIKPDSAMAYNNLGICYEHKGDLGQAFDMYSKAISIDPTFAAAYSNRGDTFDEMGQPLRALEDYGTSITLNPYYAPVYYYRGLLYKRLGQTNLAAADLQKACALGFESGCK